MYKELSLYNLKVEQTELKIEKKTIEFASTVIAEVKQVSRSEFFNAATQGIKAEIVAEIWNCDYQNQQYADLEGKNVYKIYRTYIKGDKIELYLTPVKKNKNIKNIYDDEI